MFLKFQKHRDHVKPPQGDGFVCVLWRLGEIFFETTFQQKFVIFTICFAKFCVFLLIFDFLAIFQKIENFVFYSINMVRTQQPNNKIPSKVSANMTFFTNMAPIFKAISKLEIFITNKRVEKRASISCFTLRFYGHFVERACHATKTGKANIFFNK